MPDNHEVRGLAALLLYLHSRGSARLKDGALVPLDEQDPKLWDHHLMRTAETILRDGMNGDAPRRPGPYELQAVIQSAHASRARDGRTPWDTIVQLYDVLVLVTPSRGAAVARAAAIGRADTPAAGLTVLDTLIDEDPALATFQPYHATRAALLRESGTREEQYQDALERAINLCTHPPSRRYLVGLRQAKE